MKKIIAVVVAIVSIISVGLGHASAATAGSESFVKGRVLVKFHAGVADADRVRAARGAGGTIGGKVGDTDIRLVNVPAGAEQRVVAALERNPAIEFAELDDIVHASSIDTYSADQWALSNTGQSFTSNGGTYVAAGTPDADIDGDEAQLITNGSGQTVAILDSGIASDNPDITPKIAGTVNYSTAATSEDNYGHGTHVAGIVAAIADNGIGVRGVCPGCSVLNVKVLNDSGYGSVSSVVNGIAWSVDTAKARILNMSLSFNRQSKTLQTAVDNAWRKGAILVAAAGNDYSSVKEYPAAYPNVIAVAATDNNDRKADFSNYGVKWVDIAAPGVNVYSTFPGHSFFLQTEYGRALGYDVGNGTSMASPVVAGTVALAWSTNPAASNTAVRAKVQSSAEAITGTGTLWANGRVNADRAVRW